MESSQKQCRDVLVVLRTAPKALLAGYFVNAFILSFPMVAMADWLNNHIEMPLATRRSSTPSSSCRIASSPSTRPWPTWWRNG